MNQHPTVLARWAGAAVVTWMAAAPASAAITTFVDDPNGFFAAAGPTTLIDFVEPPGGPGPIAPETYLAEGLILSASIVSAPIFSLTNEDGSYGFSDGWGFGPLDPANVAFDFSQPIAAFAFERYLSNQNVSCSFFMDGTLVGQSTFPLNLPSGPHFVGWTTSFTFDRVVLNTSDVDNIYFGVVPAPSVLAVFALAGCRRGRRRR